MSDSHSYQPTSRNSLSAQLLLLTISFVMVAELLIYAPSISRFRKVYLEQHVATAHLASLALIATPDNMVSKELEEELLSHADAYSITLRHPDRRVLMLSRTIVPGVDIELDLREPRSFFDWIGGAMATMMRNDNRIMRLIGVSPKDQRVIVEVSLDEKPMRTAMFEYSSRILQLSIVISLFTAFFVYLSLHLMMVRPMRGITRAIMDFRARPEDISISVPPSDRADEIGIAARELAVMQKEVRSALNQKTRLATLGAAVAKINHDLRNSLATAVLVSDRLADIDDPEVQKVTPRLYSAIDRAVNLCSQTLNYVHDEAPLVNPAPFNLHDLITESGAAVRQPDGGGMGLVWLNEVAPGLDLTADREQVFRVFHNLGLNALQAGANTVRITADHDGNKMIVTVTDDGQGLSERARDKLYQPFAGSTRNGGTGLGLVIARDIMRAHGGGIELAETSTRGTTFRLSFPN